MIDLEKHAKHEKACSIIGKTLIFGDFFSPANDETWIKVLKCEKYEDFTANIFILDKEVGSFHFETAKDLYNYLILRV